MKKKKKTRFNPRKYQKYLKKQQKHAAFLERSAMQGFNSALDRDRT